MNRSYLLTGGNMGDRLANLSKARDLIGKYCGAIKASSSYFETAAWGKKDQPTFLNQALALDTMLEPRQLLKIILEIEKDLGRIREEKYGPRLIDIDILLYDNLILKEPHLQIPHPELSNRRFALAPLAEIAEDLIHPVLDKSIIQLLAECPDQLAVKKYSGD